MNCWKSTVRYIRSSDNMGNCKKSVNLYKTYLHVSVYHSHSLILCNTLWFPVDSVPSTNLVSLFVIYHSTWESVSSAVSFDKLHALRSLNPSRLVICWLGSKAFVHITIGVALLPFAVNSSVRSALLSHANYTENYLIINCRISNTAWKVNCQRKRKCWVCFMGEGNSGPMVEEECNILRGLLKP